MKSCCCGHRASQRLEMLRAITTANPVVIAADDAKALAAATYHLLLAIRFVLTASATAEPPAEAPH